jgi:hypothetical protein
MAESPNRIPLRRFFTAGELVSDESVGKVRKYVHHVPEIRHLDFPPFPIPFLL